MISEANKALLKQLWINYRDTENFIGACYAYEISEILDKAREEGRQEERQKWQKFNEWSSVV